MKRLFFALWPDAKTRSRIDAISTKVRQHGLRKYRADNLHCTLVFLGNVEDEVANQLVSEMADIKLAEFSVIFDRISFWPRPKVLCLTCSSQPQRLHDLVDAISDRLNQYPIRLEKRPYRAHITLARRASQNCELVFEPIEWQAQSFALVESVSTENGSEYRVLQQWPLQPVSD